MEDISAIRQEYMQRTLSKKDVHSDPHSQFDQWFLEALKSEVDHVNAMTLSTVNTDGQPSGRIVLLKDYGPDGYTFFTNYESRKGTDLLDRPLCSLTFFWPELERQLRIEGSASLLDEHASDAYFNSRPIGSRIGAIASPQSSKIEDREALMKMVKNIEQKDNPQRPSNWGGFKITPHYFEFWQGRASRLHDRISYALENEAWIVSRLAP